MKTALLIAFAMMSTALAACTASKPAATTMHNDWRTGTDHTPYRTIAPAIQCDGCQY